MEILELKKSYKAPQARVVEVYVQNVLCQSGNEPMSEEDYGNGGFSENY